MQFKTIKPDEYNKFCQILAEHGFAVADYVLMEEPVKGASMPDDVQPKSGITVLYRNNNRRKTYPSAEGNPWLNLFEQDLIAGYFHNTKSIIT